jgi:transglutaminase-like putative cysteine protease
MTQFKISWKLVSKSPSKLYVYLPISDGNQKIKSVELSKKPSVLFKEKYYSYAKYVPTGNADVSATVNADVSSIKKYKDTSNKIFLEKEPSLLMGRTRKFTKGLRDAREVYDWILSNIKFPKSLNHYLIDLREDDIPDLRSAIERKESMCGGKSELFVSMCRNMCIPARKVTGYFLRDGWTWLRNANFHRNWMDLHVWAEFYENGWWIPVDCNIAQQTGKDYFGAFPKKMFGHNDLRIAISKGSHFLVDGKTFHSLQTAHFDKGNVKVTLKVRN